MAAPPCWDRTGFIIRWAIPTTATLPPLAPTAPIPTSPRPRAWKWSTPSTPPPPDGNSAEVNPLLQMVFNGKADKAGKDTNFRGIAEFGGALYFTKGSGSNGINSIYTVPSLPTVAQAAATTLSIVPGFPTDSSKATGGDYAPFAIFFADANTMYVTDEGSANATDQTTHAGLQKWSLVDGAWKLDYVL